MTIAHLSAAGKAVARPCPLPIQIIEARAAVFDPLNCLDLGTTARRTLFGILTFFNLAKPLGSIWPRRDRLRAESLLSSDTTLYRGLSQLVAKGYITRDQIRNAGNGRFHVSPIYLTEKARTLLGLDRVAARKVFHKHPPTKVEDGQYREHTNPQQSLQKSSLAESREFDPKTRLPIALLWLNEAGLSVRAIFALMRLATAAKKRLEDIAAACKHRLETMTPREVYAYLAALTKRNQDFSAAGKQRAAESARQEALKSAKRRVEWLSTNGDGMVVMRADGSVVGTVRSRDGFVMGPRGSTPINVRLGLAIVEGTLIIAPPRYAAGSDLSQ